MPRLKWGSVSITGAFRSNNEDSYYVDPQVRFFMVADGMGGQNAGERASQMATELVPKKLNDLIDFDSGPDENVPHAIDEAIRYANAEIMALGELDPNCKSMGTTIVLVVVVNGVLFVGGIGDSRAYLLRKGKLEQLTIDHTLTEALRRAGTINDEEARHHRFQHVLHRYLGSPEANKGAEAQPIQPEPGDRLLLCSDGVTGGVDDQTIADLLSLENDPQKAAEKLVAAAEQGGSKDNITCIVIHFG